MPISGPEGVSGPTSSTTKKSQTGERLAACLKDAAGALSGNTVRALRADLEGFVAWCAERGLSPLPARAATVPVVRDELPVEDSAPRARGHGGGVRRGDGGRPRPATVRRYVFSIAGLHKAAGERSPLEHATVQRALQRMRRRKGARQMQVQGLTWELRWRLTEAAGARTIDVRNRAMLAAAYDAMLRRSELVALQVADVTIDRGG